MRQCKSEGCTNPCREYIDRRDGNTYFTVRCKSCEHLLRRYNLTYPDKVKMLEEQNYSCLCCGNVLDTSRSQGHTNVAHVDHCHTNGHVRGILCGRCNTVLGQVNEDTEVLHSLIAYIQEYCK
jgi:phage FluMu protein Com